MTVPAHTHTAAEQQLWDLMEAGDWQQVGALREDALQADQQPPSHPPPAGWRPPAAQYQTDYRNASAHYQDAHEPSEAERVAATAATVEDENEVAPDG